MEKNLGHATAYGYAKSKGYSGTEDEFAQLMADYASVGQSAAQSAEQAAASATSASGSAATASQAAQTATDKASEAVTAADTATTKASEANASADTASSAATSAGTSAQTATTAAATATTKASEANESATTAITAKTDAETARDAAAQSASEAAESARTLTIDDTLMQAGQAADSKVVGDKINNGYASITNIINGGFNANGALNTRSDRLRPATFIPVKTGDKIVISAGSLKHACGAWNGAPSTETLVRNDNVFSTADETIVSEIDGFYIVDFAKQDATQSISPADFDGYIHLYSGEIYKNTQRITQAEGEISSLQSDMNTAFTKVTVPVYGTEEIELVKSSGYYPANGVYADSSSYEHSQKIAVSEGDVLKPTSTQPGAYFRFICAYNGNSVVASAGSNDGPTSYTVPSGIDGVIVSTSVSQHETAVIVKRKTGEETRVYPIGQKLGNFNWKGDLSDGDSVELPASNVRFNVVWCFIGHISTMGKITIGIKSTSGTVKELCSVDSTYIYYRLNDGTIASEAHGLTISEDLQIKIDSPFKVNELGSITICSDGTEYTLNATPYGTDMTGAPYLFSTGAILTNCAFSWIPKDIDKPIWVFGDSWVSMYESRWPYYMVRDGHTNSWMLNGFAGERTSDAYESLVNLLLVRKPDYIVWLLGMNNGDTSTAVNTKWKSVYDKLTQLCADYGIILILYTVPNTPTINNNFKNAIVRESGYRYIDGALAVGDDGNGNWFTGYEQSSTDHNHTSGKGARALYYRILVDFPEIAGNSL